MQERDRVNSRGLLMGRSQMLQLMKRRTSWHIAEMGEMGEIRLRLLMYWCGSSLRYDR